MPPFICDVAVLLILIFCLPQGISLKCHYCESYGGPGECLNTSDEICKPGQDTCAIQTTWRGSLYSDVSVVKSCSTSNDCPPTNQTVPSCYKYASGWSCTLCCRESFCNTGASGNVPRPPPYPPVPDPLIQRLTRGCGVALDYCRTTLSWSEESRQVLINKQCTAPSKSLADNIFNRAEKCNIPADPGYCVTCCEDDSCLPPEEEPANASTVLTYQQTLLIMPCLLIRWFSR